MPAILGYHHLSLSVSGLATSAEWYRAALGFEVVAEVEGAGFRRLRLQAPESGVTLALTVHDERPDDAFDERRAGMDHVAFHVGQVNDVYALKDRFADLGIEHSEVKTRPGGGAMITLRDPDNIQVEVFGDAAD